MTDSTVESCWNSLLLTGLREDIANGKPNHSTCATCYSLREEYGFSPDFESLSRMPRLNPAQLTNLHSAEKHFKSRDAVLTSRPVQFFLKFRCARNMEECKESDFEWLKQQEEVFRVAVVVSVTDGEPFFISDAKKFIAWFLDNDNLKDTVLEISTNASLLDEFLPKMKTRKVVLRVGLDSFGECYDKTRKGRSWEKVSNTVDAFLACNPYDMPNKQRVCIQCAITRTGLPGLPDLVRWCIDRNLGMHFMKTECLLSHPEDLDSLPRWECYFDESFALLEKELSAGEDFRKNEIMQLERCRKDVSDAYIAMMETKLCPAVSENTLQEKKTRWSWLMRSISKS
jgi:MoaA/NifB/PqqE/SkfB family radical SAM enzyme